MLAITRENVLANGVASKAHVAELVWGSDPLPPFALVRLRYCVKHGSHPVLMFSQCTLLSALPRAGLIEAQDGAWCLQELDTAGIRPACGQEEPYDLVIGADVLYRQEHLDVLLHTLLQVLNAKNPPLRVPSNSNA